MTSIKAIQDTFSDRWVSDRNNELHSPLLREKECPSLLQELKSIGIPAEVVEAGALQRKGGIGNPEPVFQIVIPENFEKVFRTIYPDANVVSRIKKTVTVPAKDAADFDFIAKDKPAAPDAPPPGPALPAAAAGKWVNSDRGLYSPALTDDEAGRLIRTLASINIGACKALPQTRNGETVDMPGQVFVRIDPQDTDNFRAHYPDIKAIGRIGKTFITPRPKS